MPTVVPPNSIASDVPPTKVAPPAKFTSAGLFPGDKLEFHGSKSPNATYESFAKGLLREMAMGIGVTYEDATGDYTQATYSSVRMATNAIWGLALYRRLSEAERPEDREALAAELIDRFGPLPPEADQLLKVVAIKGLCRQDELVRGQPLPWTPSSRRSVCCSRSARVAKFSSWRQSVADRPGRPHCQKREL